MTDFDYAQFEKAFGRVLTAFRLKLSAIERDELTRTYFKILDVHRIEDVVIAGKRCIEKHRTFPKAADWLAELAPVAATCPPDRRVMSVVEADELTRAVAMRFEDHPCLCSECVRAGIDAQPLRYVPSLRLDEDLEQAFDARRGRLEVVGHWAHGEELAAWYRARAAFYGLAQKTPRALLSAVAVILGEVVDEREPGMEG